MQARPKFSESHWMFDFSYVLCIGTNILRFHSILLNLSKSGMHYMSRAPVVNTGFAYYASVQDTYIYV